MTREQLQSAIIEYLSPFVGKPVNEQTRAELLDALMNLPEHTGALRPPH
jgi:hypothetical protein